MMLATIPNTASGITSINPIEPRRTVPNLRESEPAPVTDLGIVHAELVAVVPQRDRLRHVVGQGLEPRHVARPVLVTELAEAHRLVPTAIAKAQLGLRKPRRVDRVSEPLGESEDLRVRAIGGGLRFGTHPSISGR